MAESLDLVATFIGFGLIVFAGARLGAGSHFALSGLFPAQGLNDWPHGVQEADAPRFALDHVGAPRPAVPVDGPSVVELAEHELAGQEPATTTLRPIEPQVRRVALHR